MHSQSDLYIIKNITIVIEIIFLIKLGGKLYVRNILF